MKIIDSDRIAFIQGVHNDNTRAVMADLRSRCEGVDKIAMVRRTSDGDTKTTLFTFWFKGHNGKQDVRYTYMTDVF